MSDADLVRLRALRQDAAMKRHEAVRQRERMVAGQQQLLIDTEIRTTRQALLRGARRRGGSSAAVLFDSEFLTVADPTSLTQAVVAAALTVADSCDLQLLDPHDNSLRITAHHGFTPAFLRFFAHVGPTTPSACGRALSTGRPALVEDVAHSPIFTGRPTLEAMMDVGTRAVASYPLHATDGTVLGVLSLHHRRPHPPRDDCVLVARGAALALTQLSSPFSAAGAHETTRRRAVLPRRGDVADPA
ncbi:GAF domain-containing protein [Actinophytocola algeriensis]|uniref:GAF domain-containing protein n=1 Tax=Actinophytocola algeriensis TaxID=1768010 RepID=A0A7W7Q1X4_9PSEU|nr:GAF domain-containing protein [Actinophytocola algeriensis]MBB4905470.1 hypothetical protein [Actinophytocola algeriensis]MBE1472845.1 hypothetical protein [Actinophytocola algeriensis]